MTIGWLQLAANARPAELPELMKEIPSEIPKETAEKIKTLIEEHKFSELRETLANLMRSLNASPIASMRITVCTPTAQPMGSPPSQVARILFSGEFSPIATQTGAPQRTATH